MNKRNLFFFNFKIFSFTSDEDKIDKKTTVANYAYQPTIFDGILNHHHHFYSEY